MCCRNSLYTLAVACTPVDADSYADPDRYNGSYAICDADPDRVCGADQDSIAALHDSDHTHCYADPDCDDGSDAHCHADADGDDGADADSVAAVGPSPVEQPWVVFTSRPERWPRRWGRRRSGSCSRAGWGRRVVGV